MCVVELLPHVCSAESGVNSFTAGRNDSWDWNNMFGISKTD